MRASYQLRHIARPHLSAVADLSCGQNTRLLLLYFHSRGGGAVFAAVLSVADLQLCQTLALKLQNFFSSLTYIGKYLAHF